MTMHFSERYGYRSVRDALQVESMDEALRNRLWNALHVFYWDTVKGRRSPMLEKEFRLADNKSLRILCETLWHYFFKKPLDTLSDDFLRVHRKLREYFLNCEWNEVYDFVQFVANEFPDEQRNQQFIKTCNNILEEEMAGYRFVGTKISPIISDGEIKSIEESLENSTKPVQIHLENALSKLSDRKNPDYRNSIKESISAVETVCKLLTGDRNATLGKALRILEEKQSLHKALREGFSALYGYTSNSDGIRHALVDESNLTFTDAKFMLVSCTAFINYLTGKASDLRIELPRNL